MNNKLFLSVLSASLLTPAIVANVSADSTIENPFSDVSENSFAYEAILDLSAKGVINGYPGGQFRPGEVITRGQFAALLGRALNLPAADSDFTDVPKSKALYADISKAYAAGIVFGDTDGSFNPERAVTRADVAVMVDRALQLKGDYTNTGDLMFADSGSVPRYALESVKRLTNYEVIAGKGNNTFAPYESADRAQSSVFIWRMLNLLDSPVSENPIVEEPPVEEPTVDAPQEPEQTPELEYPEGDARNYSYAEIKTMVGEWKVVERRDGDGKVIETDLIEQYMERLRDPMTGSSIRHHSPNYYFDRFYDETFHETHIMYNQAFPEYELISINGVPYRESKYFYEGFINPQWKSDIRMNNLIASPPTETGKFLIDIGTLNQDVVTYEKGDIEIEKLAGKPKAASTDFLVDVKGVFNDTNLVMVSADGLTIAFGDNVLKLTAGSSVAILNGKSVTLTAKVEMSNGKVIAPIQSVAKTLGLSTRKMSPNPYKIEIANYKLPLEDSDGSLDGWQP